MAVTISGTSGITTPGFTSTAASTVSGGALTAAGVTLSSGSITYPNADTQAVGPLGGTGSNQTWQNVGASRAINTTYTNSTGRPIFLALFGSASNGSAPDITATISGVASIPVAAFYTYDSAGVLWAGNALVPAGATYLITGTGGTSITRWYELR